MRQVAKRLKDGRIELIDVPEPSPPPGAVSVRVEASVLSAGTERATLDVARKGLLAKARARPDQARQVIERARTDGIRQTVGLVRERLEELGPLGYSAAGTIIEAGSETRGLAPGDRVAIAGGGFANHAEVDVVPALLCARVPSPVGIEDAAFATLGAIAMHGFRRSEAAVGATVAVIGLGLIGQLAVRIARAAGCRVLAVDLSPARVSLAASAGAQGLSREDLGSGERWEAGADAVLICAAASSDDPVRLAATLARDRAKVVVVGDVPMELPRGPYYGKELDLRLARSYGPGRYDPDYELHGLDYPIGHVRWTEQRNMSAFLELLADDAVQPGELVTDRFPILEVEKAFAALDGRDSIGIVLRYGEAAADSSRPKRPERDTAKTGRSVWRPPATAGNAGFGLIGAGRFATSKIIPGLIGAGLRPRAIASASGLSAESARSRFGFSSAHARAEEVLESEGIDLLVVATRHDSHADLAAAALEAGVAVYVEKPLALEGEGLLKVMQAQRSSGAPLIVGFNRRFSPLATELRKLPGPRLMSYRVNAGRLPRDHWTNDLAIGGGRLKGEGCHFIDFLCDQAGSDPVSVTAGGFRSDPALALAATDNFSIQIAFEDGGVGVLNYAADAPTAAGKERFETSGPGLTAVIDDFRTGAIWAGRNRKRIGGRQQDKGFEAQYAFLDAVLKGEAEPPDPDPAYLSTLTTLAAARSLETGRRETVVMPDGGG